MEETLRLGPKFNVPYITTQIPVRIISGSAIFPRSTLRGRQTPPSQGKPDTLGNGLSAFGIPKPHAIVVAARDDAGAIGAEGYATRPHPHGP